MHSTNDLADQVQRAHALLLDEVVAAAVNGPNTLLSTPADDEARMRVIEAVMRVLRDPANADLMPRVGMALLWAWDFDPDTADLVHELLRRFVADQIGKLTDRGAFDD